MSVIVDVFVHLPVCLLTWVREQGTMVCYTICVYDAGIVCSQGNVVDCVLLLVLIE